MMANTRLQRYDKRQLLYSFNLLSEESALPNHISLVAVERALVRCLPLSNFSYVPQPNIAAGEHQFPAGNILWSC